MSHSIAIARETLLDAPGLSEGQLAQVMDRLLSRQVDAADIYFQYGRLESWVLEDGIVKEGSHSIEQGAGLRAISGEKTGFAYSDEIVAPALMQVADAASAIARTAMRSLPEPVSRFRVVASTPPAGRSRCPRARRF